MMGEKRFTIVGEEYVGYTQGNAYIITNCECKFSLWESKEDAQKVCNYLNEQQTTISRLEDENERLRKQLNEMFDLFNASGLDYHISDELEEVLNE